jgi:hypothetical protein
MSMKCSILAALVCMATAHSVQAQLDWPTDSGVVRVTAYGALGDGTTDDTAAIQAALNAFPSGNTIFYFQPGTFLLTDTLRPAIDDGVTKRNIFQGAGTSLTTLRLADNLNFANAVIDFRAGAAQFFRNGVRDLTIDIGIGNPLASGLKFNASNQGIINNVLIRSAQGGLIGLDHSHSGEIGPLLVWNTTIDGFATGIRSEYQTASQTYEHIALRNQTSVGWRNTSTQTVFGRKLTSTNSVTAVQNDGEGRMVLVDSTLTGTGAASGLPAIRNQKAIFLRDIAISGYGSAVTNQLASNRGNQGLTGNFIEEYWANGAYNNRRGGPYELFPSPDTTLRLPVHEAPVVPAAPLSQWAGPQQFGGIPNDGLDDTAAIQAAINSGAKTIYLPRGTWTVNGTVNLNGTVNRLTGSEARLTGTGKISLQAGTESVVTVERLESPGLQYEHAAGRVWSFQSMLGMNYTSLAGAGDLFLTDVTPGPLAIRAGQRLWARQLNSETNTESSGEPAKLLNDGGTVWILGYKTENAGTLIKTINGGKTELLGGLHVAGFGTQPMFETVESSFVATIALGAGGTVRETRNGVTLNGTIGTADIYTAFSADAIRHHTIILDNNSAGVTKTGTWTASEEFPGGYIENDFQFSNTAGSTARYTPDLPAAGRYKVSLRWVDERSGQTHSGHGNTVPVRVDHAGGSQTFSINMDTGGGQWVTLGEFDFLAGSNGSVLLSVDGAGGKVIADGVRFQAVPEPVWAAVLSALAICRGRRARRR